MVRKSEDRSYELSSAHYAHGWKTKTYSVAETNQLAVECCSAAEKSDDLALEMIRRFHSMLYKFMKLLVTGKPDHHNASQRAFLNLFTTERVMGAGGYAQLAAKCTIIFRHDTPDDIYNQLVAIFLQLLQEFNPTMNVGFTYYVDYFFKYHLKKYMVSRYYDAMDYQHLDSEDISAYIISEQAGEQASSHTRAAVEVEGAFYEEDHVRRLDTTVDIVGGKGFGPFKDLSTFERYVVYLLTVRGYKRAVLLEMFGISNNKLTSIINRIKKKTGVTINGD